jgi:hypothetical protein
MGCDIDFPNWPIVGSGEVFGGSVNTSKYAYSLNGTDWRGEFGTRKEARLAAMAAAGEMCEPPREVYVGKLTPSNRHTSGHALNLIRAINQRTELSGKSVYLTGMKVDQVEELDRELANVIDLWLKKHALEPAPSVSGISEYPVPLPAGVKSGPSDEVVDLGVSGWIGDF